MTLPKLPEPAMPAFEGEVLRTKPYYTANQMLAFQRETVQACIAVCREQAMTLIKLARESNWADCRHDFRAEGAQVCEEEIRALLEDTHAQS